MEGPRYGLWNLAKFKDYYSMGQARKGRYFFNTKYIRYVNLVFTSFWLM